ncbi:MAG: hypothetical protein HKO75_08550 [Flavobacteriaceae bacterium]|nr:hypothetical protein [Muriicola sp.]MBT8290990.1 hypothetical protein [Muriicola sp.]NNK19709.1 hypothetical protein [Flavobacteriaceae bacterium]NNK36188.1 hypothetical protein [Eudoraea sp.]NNL39894.1 hypothetical protein [Flavobacteriaceae bacterium]
MNVTDFTYLLQHPDKVVDPVQTRQLEEVVKEYPYFQAARALQLKGLKNLNSFRYNNALKATAAYTADRDVLFDLITSPEFLQNSIADTISGKTEKLEAQEVEAEEVIAEKESPAALLQESVDAPLPRNTRDAEDILDPSLFTSKDPEIDKEIAQKKAKAAEELELGQPLAFTKKEKHSFLEWLQLSSSKPIESRIKSKEQKADIPENMEFPIAEESEKKKKFDLIDRFLEDNPKIIPQEQDSSKVDIRESTKINSEELMTATLARVYLEQKKYKKALQAYKILSLKYPEKSSFFASRIKAVKQLQKENS